MKMDIEPVVGKEGPGAVDDQSLELVVRLHVVVITGESGVVSKLGRWQARVRCGQVLQDLWDVLLGCVIE